MQITLTSKLIVSNSQGAWEHITNYTYGQTYFSPLKYGFDLLQLKWIAWTEQFPWVQWTTKGNEAWYTMIYWRHTMLLSDQMTQGSMCSLQTTGPSNSSPLTCVLHWVGFMRERLLALMACLTDMCQTSLIKWCVNNTALLQSFRVTQKTRSSRLLWNTKLRLTDVCKLIYILFWAYVT